MDFELSEEHRLIQQTARRVSKEIIAPRAAEMDITGEYPHDVFKAFKDTGLTGLTIPTQYGGSGAGMLALALAVEEAAKYCCASGLMLLLSALSWSVSILYTRAHKWISSPFQLVFWQALLASLVLLILAPLVEGAPQFTFSPRLALLFLYTGLVGTAYAFWALAIVNRALPASTTALGILATPVVGIAGSTLFLGEAIDLPLIFAAAMILSGIAIGTLRR